VFQSDTKDFFGDNKYVVDSATKINANLYKKHNILSSHRMRDCIPSKMEIWFFVAGEVNVVERGIEH
jgi:hypothetical protein